MTYQNNINRLYLIKAIRFFLLIMPVVIPFFRSKGLSMAEIMILQSVFSFSVVLFEVPSGYFGDVVGKKFSIVLGMLLSSVGFLLLYFSYGYVTLIFSEIVLGLAASFISGSDSALLYDSLLKIGKTDDYVKYQGRFTSAGNFSEATAGLVGGFLATFAIGLPILVHSIVLLLGFLVALTLKEVPIKRMNIIETNKNFKAIFKLITNNQILKWWLAFTAVVAVGTLTTAWLAQAFFESIQMDLKFYGILWAALNLIVGIGALLSNTFKNNFKQSHILYSIMLTVCLGLPLAGFANSALGVLFILMINFFRGIKEPIIKERINYFSPSDKRATILSLNNLIFRLAFASLIPIGGFLLDVFPFKTAMSIYFLPLLLLGLFAVFMIGKLSKNDV